MTESRSPGPPRSAGVLRDLPASGERRACGRAARKRARRGRLGDWEEGDRGHDALETILAQNRIRVPELVPLRHQRMAASAWNYYRGAAAVMACDPVAIDGYIGKGPKFAAAIVRFARLYADQNERDHAQLVSAIAAGTVESLPG
jgi:hypothetical protein